MFRKNGRELDTSTDLQIKNFATQIAEERRYLISAIETCIARNGVIALYPDGADKNKAIKDAEKAKYSLLSRIEAHDELMWNYNEMLTKKNDRRTTTTWRNTFSTSHELVEIAYRNFYKE